MDKITKTALDELARAHDDLVVRVASLMAIVGAISETVPVDVSRVDVWCREIAQQSDRTIGVGQTAIQRMAHDFLRGVKPPAKGQT